MTNKHISTLDPDPEAKDTEEQEFSEQSSDHVNQRRTQKQITVPRMPSTM
jgi:hypothetical protein